MKVFEADYVGVTMSGTRIGDDILFEYQIVIQFREFLLDQLFDANKFKIDESLDISYL